MEQPQTAIAVDSTSSTSAVVMAEPVVQEVEVASAPPTPTRQMTNSSLRSVYSA